MVDSVEKRVLNQASPRSFTAILAVLGLGLIIFALVALSGPGRIDIVDGQSRFEAGRSLYEYGDSVIRDERVWWGVFPGKDGQPYTYYRLPQSLLAAAAIALADYTGPISEGRRHFYFVLSGALAAALLAMVTTIGFLQQKLPLRSALAWGGGIIVATPCWFYGTSTFDEILCSLVVVSAFVLARGPHSWKTTFGIAAFLAIAFHCKQPLVAFVLPLLVLNDNRSRSRRERGIHAAILLAGIVVGFLSEKAYDYSKFPFNKWVVHAELLKNYLPVFGGEPLGAFAALLISPATGFLWFCPPIFLGMKGILARRNLGESRFFWVFLLTAFIFVGFFCTLSFIKGDPAWGPRYLTPLFAVVWLWAPEGAKLLRPWLVKTGIALGIAVQLLALSVEHHRLYIEHKLPSGVGAGEPRVYFFAQMSHLWNRPREIAEVWRASSKDQAGVEFSPAPSPTFAFPVIDPPYLPVNGPEGIARYHILHAFRPWWISQQFLPPGTRPVHIGHTVILLLSLAVFGGLLLTLGIRKSSSGGD